MIPANAIIQPRDIRHMALADPPDPARKAAGGGLFRMKTGAENRECSETQDNSGKRSRTGGRGFSRYRERFG